MELIIVTDSGCEDACAKEISRWVKAKPQISHNILRLSCGIDDAVTLAYRLQTARKVLIALCHSCRMDGLAASKPDPAIVEELFFDGATFKIDAEILRLMIETDEGVIGEDDGGDSSASVISSSDAAESNDVASAGDYSDDVAGDDTVDGEFVDDETGEIDEESKTKASSLPMSQELLEEVAGWCDSLDMKVDLRSPDFIISAVMDPDGIVHIGVDMVGFPLSKREYRVMLSRRSLKATVAAAFVIYSGAKDTDLLLDPMSDDGTPAIEAALMFSRTSPLHFAKRLAFQRFKCFKDRDWRAWKLEQDKMRRDAKVLAYCAQLREMKAARTNSKLAGVDKSVVSTKVSVDWMDLKLDEKSVDKMITSPPLSGKSLAPRLAEKTLDNLFNQAEYVLKKNGTITCIVEKPQELKVPAEKHKFKLVEARTVLMGKREMTIVTYKK